MGKVGEGGTKGKRERGESSGWLEVMHAAKRFISSWLK